MHKAIRYIGSKQKLLSFLNNKVFSDIKPGYKIFEGFVGSGIISQFLAENYKEIHITGADISKYSEPLFLIPEIHNIIEEDKLFEIFKGFDNEISVSSIFHNEFSMAGKPETYHEPRNFYHPDSAIKIDTYKAYITRLLKEDKINCEQAKTLMFFLISYACKSANTTSVFGAFLKGEAKYKELNSDFLLKVYQDLLPSKNNHSTFDFIKDDILSSLDKIDYQNIIYLDPPYNTRKYESNYHILNYVADLDFNISYIKNTKTGLPVEQFKNPFGNVKQTEVIFSDMILKGTAKSDNLFISYNTDGVIQQEWMENFCQQHNLILNTEMLSYKRFKSKESNNNKELEEIVWNIKK